MTMQIYGGTLELVSVEITRDATTLPYRAPELATVYIRFRTVTDCSIIFRIHEAQFPLLLEAVRKAAADDFPGWDKTK